MNPIKIAYVIGSMGNARAGTEKSLVTLIENLDKSRFEPLLYTLQDCEYMQSKRFVCETHCLHTYSMFTPGMFGTTRALAEQFQKLKVEVVQTFFTEAHLVGGMAARRANINAIISSRRNLGYAYSFKERLYLRIANRYPNRFLVNSKSVAEAVAAAERIPLDKIDVIYNGVEPTQPDAESSDSIGGAKRVMLVANLREVKSVETLLKAAPLVIEQVPDVRFEIVGDGIDRRRLEQVSNNLQLGKHLIFHGSRPDVGRLLSGASVGVLTSRSEGFSNSILEYMRAGLPVVATAVGGNREVVDDGKTGYLIPHDSQDQLAQKLIQLLTDQSLRSEMGEAGRKLLEDKFTLQRMVDAHQDYYIDLLRRNRDA